MRYSFLFVVVSVTVFNSVVIATNSEDNNLKNALNSIENRQRQLIKSNYGVPKQDTARALPTDDENLMYLDSKPPDYDVSHHSRYNPQSKWQYDRNFDVYGDDRSIDDGVSGESYQRALNERLLDQLLLDMLRNGDGSDEKDGDEYSSFATGAYRRRPPYQKKSFFREREINEISENLQNLNPDSDGGDGYPSSSFRERVKSKLRSNPHRRLATALYKNADDDDIDDDKFLNIVNPLRSKYERDIDSDTLTEEDAALLLKYLSDEENRNGDTGGYDLPEQTYFMEGNKARDRSKRYWLGSNERPKAVSYSIRKRSTGSGKKPSPTSDRNATAFMTKIDYSQPRVLPLKASAETASNNTENGAKVVAPSKRGQKEVPVDLQSLKPLNIKKKSVDWSDYFGVDKRRQKKSNAVLPKEQQKNDVLLDQYIQSHILQSVRNSAFNNHGSQYRRYFPKRDAVVDWNRKRYETTADDLKMAEDLLLERLLKYTGAHEGVTDPVELERFRQRVINELAAAYSLEKLIDELQNENTLRSVERSKREHQHSNRLTKNMTIKKDNPDSSGTTDADSKRKLDTVSTKHLPDSLTKRNSLLDEPILSAGGGDGGDDNDAVCPIFNQIIDKCVQISNAVKDHDNSFTPFCEFYYMCNFCGSRNRVAACDLSYQLAADAFCGHDSVCQMNGEMLLKYSWAPYATSRSWTSMCDSCIDKILQYTSSK